MYYLAMVKYPGKFKYIVRKQVFKLSQILFQRFNNDGEVIGVSVGIVQSGQNLNFAIPSEYLVYLIESIDKGENLSIELPSKVPSPFTPRYKNSSKIVQKTKFGYNANIISIHDLDFIDYSRSKIDEKKPILSTDDIFIMTR